MDLIRAARVTHCLGLSEQHASKCRPGSRGNSIGDGLWHGLVSISKDAITALNLPDRHQTLTRQAQIYRDALALFSRNGRPSYYLSTDHAALDDLTDAALDRLAEGGVISKTLSKVAKTSAFKFLPEAPVAEQPPFVEQKSRQRDARAICFVCSA